jgi:hypothetical protein
MCPYCGEDVPADSGTCWKCGTELAKGAGDEQIEQRGQKEGGGGPKTECPFCQATISARALRCNDCGRVVRDGGRTRNWVPAAWAAFGFVLLATVGGVIYSFVLHHKEPEDPGRSTPLSRSFLDLERIYLEKGGTEARRRQIWRDEHEKKFVVWEQVVVRVTPEEHRAEFAESGTKGVAQVVVTFKEGQDLSALKKDKTFRYSARLVDFQGTQLFLDLGELRD